MHYNSCSGWREFEVHTHDGGAELLADAELIRAGCIILNDRMLHMDAFELLNRLREREIHLPAILLSGDATAGLRMRATAAGVRICAGETDPG